jgi:glucose-6-phosphate isomerase
MKHIRIELDKILPFVSNAELMACQPEINNIHQTLIEKKGKGNDFLGWLDLPDKQDPAIIDKIYEVADTLVGEVDVVVVIGIGGSYLGARAVIDAFNHSFDALMPGNYPLICYAGHQLSEDYLSELMDFLNDKEFALVVISKSGTTTEPAVAFRILKNMLEAKSGKDIAKKRIIAVTDKSRGALKTIADREGYETFIIPDDVGGRYSVLTPVGLLPVVLAGHDADELLKGANDMKQLLYSSTDINKNPALAYAVARNLLYRKGKTIELMVNYQPKLALLAEWWKQLYGESEGKENKGIFPAAVNFTTDLHSMGQYIQDGLRNIFETVISIEVNPNKLIIPFDNDNLDELNYIAGKALQDVNKMAELGTQMAHIDGNVPNIRIIIPELNEYFIGQHIYFFEFACAISGYMLGVNPFDQPGVEAYKKNMFKLLGKPGVK